MVDDDVVWIFRSVNFDDLLDLVLLGQIWLLLLNAITQVVGTFL